MFSNFSLLLFRLIIIPQELARHAQTFVEEQLNMLESEMSAQEHAVTEKVTQHLHEQCASPRLLAPPSGS
jgi:hypothetical protein